MRENRDFRYALIDRLAREHTLCVEEYESLLAGYDRALGAYAARAAVSFAQCCYGKNIYIRGLIEISNVCKNDCYYCGIRRSNTHVDRYKMTDAQILACCAEGYALGFRTFVMQGGENGSDTDARLAPLIRRIKAQFPDCAVTLSLGERSAESYARLREAGADRYLLRHETANAAHYRLLHPADMHHDHRLSCLHTLKRLGYQVGCGMMVGSPFQTLSHLAQDLKFVEEFAPDMCGVGPFLPQKDTPFGQYPAGSADMTCFLLSLIRLIRPGILLPATTALNTLDPQGRQKGVLSGANVVMPNLSPAENRAKYTLYDGKVFSGAEAAQTLEQLKEEMEQIGYSVVSARGDVCKTDMTDIKKCNERIQKEGNENGKV